MMLSDTEQKFCKKKPQQQLKSKNCAWILLEYFVSWARFTTQHADAFNNVLHYTFCTCDSCATKVATEFPVFSNLKK